MIFDIPSCFSLGALRADAKTEIEMQEIYWREMRVKVKEVKEPK